MTKSDLIHEISTRAHIPRGDAQRSLEATLEAICEALCDGDKVTLPGFGSIASTTSAPRTGKNPRTGEAWAKPSSKTVRFRVSSKLVDRMNQPE